MYCNKCGNIVNDGDLYCEKCGNMLNFQNPPSENIQYVQVMPNTNKEADYSLFSFILSLVILPVAALFRFAFLQETVKYGWRAYTAYVTPTWAKVTGIILCLVLVMVSVVLLFATKKSAVNNKKGRFFVPALVIDIVATAISIFVLLS